MKYLLLAGAICLLLVLNSCSYVERDFLGKWKVYDLELQSEWRGNIVDDEMREYYESISYEFLPEGKMIYTQGVYNAEGSWSVDDEELEMKYRITDGGYGFRREDLKCKVLSCTAGKMALSMKFNKQETWVLYFKEVG